MELWKDWGFTWSFTWCGVGTHSLEKIPADVEELIKWIGHCMALIGGVLATGDAPGCDTFFWIGYEQGRKESSYTLPPAQIYYTRKKNQRNSTHSPKLGYHELEMYPDTAHIAADIAYEARGSFEGLFPSGIALHTRNAFQVLSEDLLHPRKFTVLFAKPVGKQGKCAGGTNTANMISRKNKIPVVNLWIEEERTKFIEWVKRQLTIRNLPIPPLGATDGQA